MIWLNEKTGELYIGDDLLSTLSPLERSLLIYLINHPYSYLTKTDLIENTWPDRVQREGVSDVALYQLIYSLRSKIGRHDSKTYIETWRGNPEGGYRFLPNAQKTAGLSGAQLNGNPEYLVRQILIAVMESQTNTFEILRKQAATLLDELGDYTNYD